MPFSQSFTGKGTAVVLPENQALKSQEGLNAIVTKAEEIRYARFKENRAEFLKNTQIDPVFVLSDAARKTQMDLINNFKTKWGKIAAQKKGELSWEDNMNMQTEKDAITSIAQQQVSEMQMYLQQKALIEKDMGANYDSEAFIKTTLDDYMESGRWNHSMDEFLRPYDFGQAVSEVAMKQPYKIPAINESGSAMRNVGGGKQVEEYYTVPENQVGGLLASVFADNPRARKDALLKWAGTDKEKYDYNINKWLNETYGPRARQIMSGTPSTIPGYGIKTSTTFDWNIGVDAKHNQNDAFTDKGRTPFSDKVILNHYYGLGSKSFTSDPQEILSYTDLTTGQPVKLNKAVATRFEVVGYSPDKDILIVKISDAVPGLIQGKLIGLDADKYDDLLRGKPFGIDKESLIEKSGGEVPTYKTGVGATIKGGGGIKSTTITPTESQEEFELYPGANRKK